VVLRRLKESRDANSAVSIAAILISNFCILVTCYEVIFLVRRIQVCSQLGARFYI